MYVHCIETYIQCICSTYTLYRSIFPLQVQSYAIQDEVINPLAPRKYTVLNGNSVLNLCDFFQEHNLGAKRDMPVHNMWIPFEVIRNLAFGGHAITLFNSPQSVITTWQTQTCEVGATLMTYNSRSQNYVKCIFKKKPLLSR